jgi:hypothetical protein
VRRWNLDYYRLFLGSAPFYNFNEYVALGIGAQYISKTKNYYASHLYGGSIIGLFNPYKQSNFLLN